MRSNVFTAIAATGLILVGFTGTGLVTGCRGDSPSGERTTRTPAAQVAQDAGVKSAPARPVVAAKPAPKTASAEFHLDETSTKRTKTRTGPTGTGRTLHLTIRSTPSGATAAVDGRVVGTTPTYWEGPANGRTREFTFVHAGYAMARYRFVATSDGVLHGTLTKVVVETIDAGASGAPPPQH